MRIQCSLSSVVLIQLVDHRQLSADDHVKPMLAYHCWLVESTNRARIRTHFIGIQVQCSTDSSMHHDTFPVSVSDCSSPSRYWFWYAAHVVIAIRFLLYKYTRILSIHML